MSPRAFQKASILERLFAGHHDVVAALRSLSRSPGFVAIAVLSLGLAIGLTTTTFAMLDAIEHPYLPFTRPSELFTVSPQGWSRTGRRTVARDMYLAMRDRKDLYRQVVPWTERYNTVEANRHLVSGYVAKVGPEFFEALGVQPIAGRAFAASTDEATGGDPVLISEALWQNDFGARSDLGSLAVTFDGQTHPIIGVMPPAMDYPAKTVVWRAMPHAVARSAEFGRSTLHALVRIRMGDKVARVSTELAALAARFATDAQQDKRLFDYEVEPLAVGPQRVDRLHQSLAGASLLILLVACLNLANLMLARGLSRRRELAVRKAVGASNAALMRFSLTEAAVLAIGGGLWGVMLSLWGVRLASYRMPSQLVELGFITPHVSWRIVLFGIGVTATTVLVAGMAPALQARRTDPNDAIKDGGATTGKRNRTYSVLAVGQVALALVVMMGAGLLLRAARDYAAHRFEGDPSRVIEAVVTPDSATCAEPVRAKSFMTDLAAAARGTPGVVQTSVTATGVPMHGIVAADVSGREYSLSVPYVTWATPNYLRTRGVRIAQGRDFEPGDAASSGVVIVNQRIARGLWRTDSPVGHMMKLGPVRSDLPWLPVVGVTQVSPDTVNNVVFDAAPDVTVVGGSKCDEVMVAARAAHRDPQTPIALFHVLRAAVPGGYVGDIRWGTAGFENSVRAQDFLAGLFTALGMFGLALAAFGVYGVLSYVVSQRMREFGMRVALGAQPRDVRRIVLHDALVIVLAGTGVGAWGAMWGGHFLSHGYYLYHISYSDVFALVGAEALLMAVTLAACIGPVREASSADPVDLLRST